MNAKSIVSIVNKKVGDHLVREKLLTPQQLTESLAAAADEAGRIEESVLDLGFVTEAALLKSLSGLYKTQFVSTEKLAKLPIDKPTLAMIPRDLAEMLAMFPVMFDPKTATLSVVTADPENMEILREVQHASGARAVKAFVARPRAVKAAIARAHAGDLQAFARLEMAAQAHMHGFLEVKRRSTVPPPNLNEREVSRDTLKGTAELPKPPLPPRPPTEKPPGADRVVTEKRSDSRSKLRLGSLTPPPMAAALEKATSYSADEFLELLNVLISLLENARQDLRGHSAHVARLTRRLVERMNLPAKTTISCVTAAYIHDLGKMGNFHLTALNCAEYDGHKAAAQKAFRTPTRLLEAVRLSQETTDAVSHMYERFDGKGFPDGLSGKEVPLPARILAITDTYADLTQNPRNPYRKALSPGEACEVLMKFKRSVFDPDVVDLFHSVVMGEDLKARLLADRYVALLVDPDPEETTVLELRMIEQGFEVKIARNAEQATKILAEGRINLVISEMDLPQTDGITLLAEARKQPWGKDLAWVMHTRRQGRAEAQRAFELGVLDFVPKPTATDVLVAKLKARLDHQATQKGNSSGGVSGSLKEMGLPDMVQVLFHGRKTGSLKITHGPEAGEIHFLEGAVVNALWGGKKGAGAFYEMLKLTEGDFALDPGFKPTERLINESAEALLLEGMRRMDEGLAG